MKNILLIMPSFFGYEKVIKNKMIELGWNVHFYSDRPSESSFVKAAIRINYRIISGRVREYYDSIVAEYEEGYFDKVVIVRGEAVSLDWLEAAKKKNPSAEFILYLWDSVAYNKNVKCIKDFFDRVLSFDAHDCDEYGFIYRPLFSPDVYFDVSGSEKKYDLIFVGTVYSDRYKALSKIIDRAKESGMTVYLHAYYPSRFFALLRGAFDEGFRQFYNEHVTHEKLSQLDTANLIASSRAVVDINRESQEGLTMRTIEAMAAKTKLITTNSALKSAPEFNCNIHAVIDRETPVLDDKFIRSDYVSSVDLNKFTVEAWVIQVLGVNCT